MGTVRNSHSPDLQAMEVGVEVQPFMVEPWGYTGLGPHQELTDAEGCQWPSGGLLGSGGSKEVHPGDLSWWDIGGQPSVLERF